MLTEFLKKLYSELSELELLWDKYDNGGNSVTCQAITNSIIEKQKEIKAIQFCLDLLYS